MVPDKIYTDNRRVYAVLPIFSQIDANVCYIRKDALIENALDLINAVERYVRQECSRSTLLAKKDNLKKLIEE